MSVTNFKKKFIHRFLVNAVLCAIFFLLLSLGFWQLHRADEKKIILQGFAEQQKQSALNWNGQKLLQFTPIHMKGRALKTMFYLDNQFYQHKIGYHLIVPVMDQWDNLVLVDLGWVPAKSSRAQLPKVDIPNWRDWGGFVFYPKLSKLDLGHFLDRQISQNYVIEHLDVAKIEKLLKRKVMPWILRASSNPLRGVVQDWPLVSVKPERHYAYALQWFLMAAVILIVLIWRWKK
jgi:surfeit locus 1 family protein